MTTESVTTEQHHLEPKVEEALQRKLLHRGVSVQEPIELSEVGERLDRFLASRVEPGYAIRGLSRLPGGASKEQFVFTLDRTVDGAPREERMVLRMDPLGSPVESARSREADVLRIVGDALPVPVLYWSTDDASELGAPAIISQWVSGVAGPTDAPMTASIQPPALAWACSAPGCCRC